MHHWKESYIHLGLSFFAMVLKQGQRCRACCDQDCALVLYPVVRLPSKAFGTVVKDRCARIFCRSAVIEPQWTSLICKVPINFGEYSPSTEKLYLRAF